MDTAVQHLHCIVFPCYIPLPFPFSHIMSLFVLPVPRAQAHKTQWDVPEGNKDGNKAAGLCVLKAVAKSIAYPGATWIGSENSSLILKKSHSRLSLVALRKLPKLTRGSFGLKIDGICFDREKRLELHCNSLLIGFEDLFDHLQRGVKQPFV